MMGPTRTCRRRFIGTSLASGLGAMAAGPLLRQAGAVEKPSSATPCRVALTAGDDRADNTFRGLREFAPEISRAIGDRRVLIKPNNVSMDVQLAATHADCLEGTLEFLKSIGKLKNVVIAESAAMGPAMEAFSNFSYLKVAEKYGAKVMDLDHEETETVYVFNQTDFKPRAVRMSRLLLDPDNYIISSAKIKTHDMVVATLSLKNIVLGAPVKDIGFRWGKSKTSGKVTHKPIAHGGGIRGINYNLFDLSRRLHPDLAVIDGYRGMQGNGPIAGEPVDHRVCVVSPDWLAADRVGVELMGMDFAKIGYLNYCAQAKSGQADLAKIEILGEPVARHVRSYELHENVEGQLTWMMPTETS